MPFFYFFAISILLASAGHATGSARLMKQLPKKPVVEKSGPPLRLFELRTRSARLVTRKEKFLPKRVYYFELPSKKEWVPILTDELSRLPQPLEVLQPDTVLPSAYLGQEGKGNYILTPSLKWAPSTREEVHYLAVLSLPPQSRIEGFRPNTIQPEQVVVPTILELARSAPPIGGSLSSADCQFFSSKSEQWENCPAKAPTNSVLFKKGNFVLSDGYGDTDAEPKIVRVGSCLPAKYFGKPGLETAFLRDEKTWVWLSCWTKAEFSMSPSQPLIQSWIVEPLQRPPVSMKF